MACSPWTRCDGSQKQKIGHSICIYAMFLIIGWVRGLFGPSFVDIEFISQVSIKLGSWISTLNFIGSTLGCLTGGFLYDKVNKKVLYGTGLLLLGMVTAGVPWCFVFVLMAAAHFFQGFFSGVIDTVANAEMMYMWTDNKMMFFFVEFSYSLGAFVAPIFVAPFVLDDANGNYVNHDDNETSINGTLRDHFRNITEPSGGVTSRLFIPYSITTALAVIVCLPFFFAYCMNRDTNDADRSTEANDVIDEKKPVSKNDQTMRVLPTKLKVVCIILISTIIFTFSSVGESFMSFISVYCVDEVGFSPTDGALVSAVSNVCCIVAIIVAIFASRLNTLVFLGIHIVGTLVGLLALLFSTLGHVSLGVWISSAVVGYFRSMLFSLAFTWTNNYITPTTGKITSLFMIFAHTGSAIVPIPLGWLMEEYGSIWFCFLLTIFGACNLLLYIVGMIITKYVTTRYGKTFDIAVTDISLTDRLNGDDTLDVGQRSSANVKPSDI